MLNGPNSSIPDITFDKIWMNSCVILEEPLVDKGTAVNCFGSWLVVYQPHRGRFVKVDVSKVKFRSLNMMCNKTSVLYEHKQLTAKACNTYSDSLYYECDINGLCNQDSDDSEEYDFEEMANKKPKLLIHTTYKESHTKKSGCQPVTSNKFPRRGYNVTFSTQNTVIPHTKHKQLTLEKWVNPATSSTPISKKDHSNKPILRNPTPYYHQLNIKFPSYKSRQTRECAFDKITCFCKQRKRLYTAKDNNPFYGCFYGKLPDGMCNFYLRKSEVMNTPFMTCECGKLAKQVKKNDTRIMMCCHFNKTGGCGYRKYLD